MPTRSAALAGGLLVSLPLLLSSTSAQEPLPWQRGTAERYQQRDDAYRQNDRAPRYDEPADADRPDGRPPYAPRSSTPGTSSNDPYAPRTGSVGAGRRRLSPAEHARVTSRRGPVEAYPPRPGYAQGPYPPPPSGQPYPPAAASPIRPAPAGLWPALLGARAPLRPALYAAAGGLRRPARPPLRLVDYDRRNEPGPPRYDEPADGSYSTREIMAAGHGFFGTVSKGLASVVEYAFQKQGRPNGYILGQDAGGAFVAGLRYGEGILYTKDAGSHRVYWQGPSIG